MEQKTLTIQHEGQEFQFTVEEWPSGKQIHLYVKEIWWGVPTDAGVDAYIDALHYGAKRLEALTENGWNLADSDGEHLYFRKSDESSDDENPHEITRELE